MQRQRIKEELGALEERLSLLEAVALKNEADIAVQTGSFVFAQEILARESLESLRNLDELIHQQSLQKSITAEEFLQKVISVFLKEAVSVKHEIALSHFAEGRVSVEMVEIAMGAIVACLRASLKSYQGMYHGVRMQKRLFGAYSIYLEVRANAGGLYFRLMDDGLGYSENRHSETELQKQFQKMRTHIARFGGWFGNRSFPTAGGMVEFKLPFPQARFEAVVVHGAGCEILVPSACVGEVRQSLEPGGVDGIYQLDSEAGLVPATESTIGQTAVHLGAADFQLWILCDRVGEAVKARRYDAGDWLETDSWFRQFGVFQKDTHAEVLPLLDGEVLMRFHSRFGGKDASL